MSTPTSKTVCQFYFGEEPVNEETQMWRCRCRIKRKCNIQSGYGNLLSHIKAQHPNYLQEIAEFMSNQKEIDSSPVANTKKGNSSKASSSQTLNQASVANFFNNNTKKIYGWLDWIVESCLPLNFCEQETTRKYAKLDPIGTKTLKKYLYRVADLVEAKITKKTLDIPSFVILFDGWSAGSFHFIGVFIMFPSKNGEKPKCHLLACAPLDDETTFTAQNHHDFIITVLSNYKLPISKMIAIVGDNCNTNKALADLLKVPLIGCRSHRLNLGVEAFLAEKLREEMDIITKLMSKLGNLKQSGRLRLYTQLRPKQRNITRWIGAITMILRFFRLKDKLVLMDRVIRNLLPSSRQEANLKNMIKPLKKLLKATKALQKSDLTLLKSELLLNHIITKFEDVFDFDRYIGPQAQIVHSPEFESAIIKIQALNESDLTLQEKAAVRPLLKLEEPDNNQDPEINTSTESDEFVEQAYKKQRTEKDNSAYIDTSFIPPTSNECERLFSLAKRVYSDHRKSMSLRTLESLLFLKKNRGLWDIHLVAEALQKSDNEIDSGSDDSEDDDEETDDE